MPIIRPSQPRDLSEITAIYAHHVHHGTGTFEIDAPTEVDMSLRRQDVLSKNLPYLVIVSGKNVLGFAYCNWFKPRPAYRFCAEDSIYLSPQASGKGLGGALLAELMVQAERSGVRKMVAVIGDSRNLGSIGVHLRAGFNLVGTLNHCGWKFDQWLDVVLMDKSLGNGDSCPPTPHGITFQKN